MISETVTINEQKQITLPDWFFEKTDIKEGSQLTINFDEATKQFLLLLNHDEKPKDKKPFQSGFGMVKTHLSAKDLDVDVAQFAKDI